MMTFKDYMESEVTEAEQLDEKMYFDYKTRNGKKVKKWHTTRKNYRIQINKKTGQPKEVFITPMERPIPFQCLFTKSFITCII